MFAKENMARFYLLHLNFYWHITRHVTVHLLQSVFTSVVLVIRKQIFMRVTITVLSSIESIVYRIAF